MTILLLFTAAAETRIFRQNLKRRHPFTREPRLVSAKVGLQILGQLGESSDSLIIKKAVPAAKIAERLRISIADEPQFRTIPGAQMKVGTLSAGRAPAAFHCAKAVVER